MEPGQINKQILPVSWALKRLTDSGTDKLIMRIYGEEEVKVSGILPGSQACAWWVQVLCRHNTSTRVKVTFRW